MEIERKFLVDAPPAGLASHRSEPIAQGYLAIAPDGVEVRVRRRGDATLLTIKSGPAMVRVEEELAIEPERFDVLWGLTTGRRIEKTRYYVPLDGGLVVELDVYAGAHAGLLTAEIEFPSAEASRAFVAPAWLGREVTGDSAYANQNLALQTRSSTTTGISRDVLD